jgi:hypothetical protein
MIFTTNSSSEHFEIFVSLLVRCTTVCVNSPDEALLKISYSQHFSTRLSKQTAYHYTYSVRICGLTLYELLYGSSCAEMHKKLK